MSELTLTQIPKTNLWYLEELQKTLGPLIDVQMKELRADIIRYGIRNKLVAYKVDDKLVLIDGVHRVQILTELKQDYKPHLEIRELPESVTDTLDFLVHEGVLINRAQKMGRIVSKRILIRSLYRYFMKFCRRRYKDTKNSYEAFLKWTKDTKYKEFTHLKPNTIKNYVEGNLNHQTKRVDRLTQFSRKYNIDSNKLLTTLTNFIQVCQTNNLDPLTTIQAYADMIQSQ